MAFYFRVKCLMLCIMNGRSMLRVLVQGEKKKLGKRYATSLMRYIKTTNIVCLGMGTTRLSNSFFTK